MQSLAIALRDTRTEFSNDLTYVHGMAPKSANSAALEREGMQVKMFFIELIILIHNVTCLDRI